MYTIKRKAAGLSFRLWVIPMLVLLMLSLRVSAASAGRSHGLPKLPDITPVQAELVERIQPHADAVTVLPENAGAYGEDVQEDRARNKAGRISLFSAPTTALSVQCLSITGTPFAEDTVWTLSVSNAYGSCSFTYELVLKLWENGIENKYLIHKLENTSSNVYRYRFTSTGVYELWVTVRDGRGNTAYVSIPTSVGDGNNRLYVRVAAPSSYAVGRTAEWQAVPVGGDGNYRFQFVLLQTDTDLIVGNNADLLSLHEKPQSSNRFLYTLLANGNYQLIVNVFDGQGNSSSAYIDFTVNTAGGQTMRNRAAQIVGELTNTGVKTDFDMALAAHDWIIQHTDYDDPPENMPVHHGADTVFFGGKTVCSGYAKAFSLLMDAAGIPCEIIVSDRMDHAWDEVKIGGKWYQVDATWNDRRAGDGIDSHMYCFIPSSIMNVDHYSYTLPHACNSLDANYYVATGWARDHWIDRAGYLIWERLQAGPLRFTVPFPASCEADQHIYVIDQNAFHYEGQTNLTNHPVMSALFDAVLRKHVSDLRSFWYQNETLDLTVTPDKESREIHAEVDCTGAVLNLPEGLKKIEAEAFSGDDSFMAVIVPASVTEIGDNAFSGCSRLWKVVFRNPNTRIAQSAFPKDTGHLNILAPKDSTGIQYAKQYGLWRLETK